VNSKLIINCDDFGLSEAISEAIVECHKKGIVTSTTLMANMGNLEHAKYLADQNPQLGIGIHFNLTEGFPVSLPEQVSSLITAEGKFYPNSEQRKRLLLKKVNPQEVFHELENQVRLILDFGIKLSHFDSHHHITGLPLAFSESMKVAKKHKIPAARITSTRIRNLGKINLKMLAAQMASWPKELVHFRNKYQLRKNGFITTNDKVLPNRVYPVSQNFVSQLIKVIQGITKPYTEIAFHPGYDSSYKGDSISMNQIRKRDFNVLISPKVKDAIKSAGIELINYHHLVNEK
jgi:predicted glycoside hydrolase/deacetylase ChbG (UPF0249 family)